MTDKEIQEEMTALSDKLRVYQKEYHVDNRPSVSDREYDRLFDKLLLLEQKYPQFAAEDSPTRRVGSDLSRDFPEVKHTIPVLSLDKCYTEQDLRSWMEKVKKNAGLELSFVVEEKIDGASLVLYYEQGSLKRAVTRGNGIAGNDVTPNVATIPTVPLKLTKPVTLAIRGEVFLPIKYFNAINETMSVPYANPRNLASGSLRRIKSSEVAKIPLDIFFYEGFFENPFETHVGIIDEFTALGFKVNKNLGFFSETADLKAFKKDHGHWFAGKPEQIGEFLGNAVKNRTAKGYEIDGLVIKVNEIPARDALGYTGHHPRWAIAYKFESPEGVTTVKDIIVQVGRTGRVTPVAIVEDVPISGSVITRVTLHNQEYVNMLELGVGDEVTVSKRGDVIPSVERVAEHKAESVWKMPELCPSCRSRLELKGAHHFCVNPECSDQLKGRLVFFAGKGQMDIENLGGETISFLFDKGLVRTIEDIFTFDPDRLIGEPGFGEKKVKLIKDGIEKCKTRDFKTVLQSLGIPDLGPKVAELLIAEGYTSIKQLFAAVDRQEAGLFTAIEGIGPKTEQMLLEELSSPSLRRQVGALKKAGLSFEAEEEEPGVQYEQVFADQAWCVTGSFERFKPRDLAMEEVKRRGGRVVSSITSKTTHLLAGSAAGSKLDKARKLNLKIVTEEEFLKLLGME
ncbi:MAG: NAD-dependent DNA ligase LigA [Spirochaetales bacterium]|nr:NAD-dependent DNA ligase LigA [Spirochaetales bacterium]